MRLTDFTFAVRNLLGRPAFALTAVLLLALGAGANAAVFSVVRGILLRPLAYTDPDRLVAIWPGSPTGETGPTASSGSPASHRGG